MEFLYSQETLTAAQWMLRAVVGFFFLLFATKIMGQRSISQLRLIDFAIAIIIGNILAHPLSDEGLGLKGPIITTIMLVLLYVISILLVLKYQRLRCFVNGKSYPLIKDNQILYKNLSKARISIDILLSELRKYQVTDIQHVALALWEPDGTISVFKKPQHQTVTRADMKLPLKSFVFPRTVVKEGKLDYHALNELGKDEAWVRSKLKETDNGELDNVLLAIIDEKDQLKIFLYK
jgi:uncharacterized membrane protein YcaP (DUF421 family)